MYLNYIYALALILTSALSIYLLNWRMRAGEMKQKHDITLIRLYLDMQFVNRLLANLGGAVGGSASHYLEIISSIQNYLAIDMLPSSAIKIDSSSCNLPSDIKSHASVYLKKNADAIIADRKNDELGDIVMKRVNDNNLSYILYIIAPPSDDKEQIIAFVGDDAILEAYELKLLDGAVKLILTMIASGGSLVNDAAAPEFIFRRR
jgi:hypothetical protein